MALNTKTVNDIIGAIMITAEDGTKEEETSSFLTPYTSLVFK
jgi:hypothetical protein